MSVPDGLLVLLRDEPKHGYQLAGDFAARTAGRWTLNTGQVYTTLDRLARDGFVAPEGSDPADSRRRLYRLTEAGRARTERWLTESPEPAATRDDLVLRVLLTVAVDPALATAVIDAQRRQLVARLQEIRRDQRDPQAAGADLIARLTTDAAAVRVESDLRWLDLCDQRLRSAATLSSPIPRPEEDRS